MREKANAFLKPLRVLRGLKLIIKKGVLKGLRLKLWRVLKILKGGSSFNSFVSFSSFNSFNFLKESEGEKSFVILEKAFEIFDIRCVILSLIGMKRNF